MERHWDTAPKREPSPPAGKGLLASRQTFCDYLVRARRQRGMSIDEISGVTRIPVRSLERLESGKFEELPGDVFVRGFLRSYARCVGLDTDEAIRRYTSCGMTPAPVASSMADELASSMATLEEHGNACVRQVTLPPARRARTAYPAAAPPDALQIAASSPELPELQPSNPGLPEPVDARSGSPAAEARGEVSSPARVRPVEATGPERDTEARQDDGRSAAQAEAAEPAGRSPRKRKRKRKRRQRRQDLDHRALRDVAPSGSQADAGSPAVPGPQPDAPGTELADERTSGSPEPAVLGPAPALGPAPGEAPETRAEAAASGAAQEPRSGDDAGEPARDPGLAAPGQDRQPATAAPVVDHADRGADQSAGVHTAERPWSAGARGQRGRARTRLPTSATRPVLVIDDEHPEDAERAQEERAARGDSSSWRSLLPPSLLDGEEGSSRSTLTLAVIILVIVATLTMSYLLRRPDVSGDGITWQRGAPGAAIAHHTGAAGTATTV